MGSQWVDGSPSWDSIGSSLAGLFGGGATKSALGNISMADQINIARAEELRKRQALKAATAAGESAVAALPEFGPASPWPQAPAPATPIPADNPWATALPAPLDVKVPQTWTDPAGAETFSRERQMFADTQRAVARTHPELIPRLHAQGTVGLRGTPVNQAEKDRMTFLYGGTFDKTAPNNFVAVDNKTGEVTRIMGASADGRFNSAGEDMNKLVPEGSTLTIAGQTNTNAKPTSILDSDAAAETALVKATIGLKNGVVPDEEKTMMLAAALAKKHPVVNKLMNDPLGNLTIVKDYVESNPGDQYAPLIAHIASTLYGASPAQAAAPAVTAPAAVPFVGGQGQLSPDAGAGGLTGVAPQVTPAQPPPTLPQYDRNRTPAIDVVKEGPATEGQIKALRARDAVRDARVNLESMMGVRENARGNPELPADAYVPDWKASLTREVLAEGTVSSLILNTLDPKAKEFFNNASAAIEPMLRIASGAVIAPNEMVRYMQMFIPDTTDSPQMKAQKLNRLRAWEGATSSSGSANQAITKLLSDPRIANDPESRAEAEKLRVRATQAGRLNTPTENITGPPGVGGTNPVVVGPAANPAAPAAPAVNPRSTYRPPATAPAGTPAPADRVVGQKYPTPRGPMTWTGPETGWQP